MQFIRETGAIISSNNGLVSLFHGDPGHVDFPDEMIIKLHKLSPGYIQRLTHVHPPNMVSFSEQDRRMMKNLARVLHPFPLRLGVISETSEVDNQPVFRENVYVCFWEPSEFYDKPSNRNFIVGLDSSEVFLYYPELEPSGWREWIIAESYLPKI